MTNYGLYEFVIVHRPADAPPKVAWGPAQLFAASPAEAFEAAKQYIWKGYDPKEIEIVVRPF